MFRRLDPYRAKASYILFSGMLTNIYQSNNLNSAGKIDNRWGGVAKRILILIRYTPKQILLQTVKTQMKCRIISSGSTLFGKVKETFIQKIQYLLTIITRHPQM